VNSGPRGAHPVQGAIFLQHFVLAEIPWAHLDIAGTAFPAKDDRYLVRGATGFGVRVVTEYLRRLAK
jgi:leucyl aminopeptidase